MKVYYTIGFQDDIFAFENAIFQVLQGYHPSQGFTKAITQRIHKTKINQLG